MTIDKTTEKLARYAAALSWEDLTPQAVHAAKRSIVDSIGCALGAFDTVAMSALRKLASTVSADMPATIIGTGLRSSIDYAGFVNASMIRYLDFSDDYFGGNGRQAGPHPSDNIGCVLALAESRGLDGKSAILGTVLAYETCNQLVDHSLLLARGWDYTIYHAAATAVAAGKLLGLNAAEIASALGIAVVSNVGMWQTRMGELSQWKALAGPNASRNGLFAALLAGEGITGPSEPFEGKAGFMKQFESPFELPPLGGQGVPFKIERTYFKYMPVMYSAQLPIWAALEMREKVDAEDIESMVLHAYAYMLSTGVFTPERANPTTRETADHSTAYLIGAALFDGGITEETFTPARFRDPKILALIRNITAVEDPAYTAAYPRDINVRLEARLRSGEVVSVRKTNPRGHPENPMTDEELSEKFLRQAGPLLPNGRAEALLESLWKLERVENLGSLFSMMKI